MSSSPAETQSSPLENFLATILLRRRLRSPGCKVRKVDLRGIFSDSVCSYVLKYWHVLSAFSIKLLTTSTFRYS